MMPMPRRRLTSVAIRLEGQVYLFDCGEGTQVPYKELHLGLRALKVVAVTHLHADHCLGLPGMLMLRAQMPDPEPLTVIGPPGLERFIQHVREDLAMYINYEVRVREWDGPQQTLAYEDEEVQIFWRPVKHSVFCLGYRWEERDRAGKFDPAAADRLGVPWGPQRGLLQRGQSITMEDGRSVQPEEVMGPLRRGRHAAFITDTTVTPALEPLMRDVDIAFLESMFLPEHAEDAREKKHLMVRQAAEAASRAGAQEVRLVHLSPRYDRRAASQMTDEARRIHPRARVAKEREIIEVPLPD